MYTLNEQDYTQLMNYLGELPAKYANPIISFLSSKKVEEKKAKKK